MEPVLYSWAHLCAKRPDLVLSPVADQLQRLCFGLSVVQQANPQSRQGQHMRQRPHIRPAHLNELLQPHLHDAIFMGSVCSWRGHKHVDSMPSSQPMQRSVPLAAYGLRPTRC